ncbi:Ger(x)C family spore germination protein [Solibacillus sp. CAU 1738]|uniref:Ger(x)C family spore germination protein n=1 Tax=Solibacillus sp. CAU 1738 TaxID=3140363 RepID=UPI003260A46E
MKKKIIIILTLPLIILSGCWDVNEPERMLYVLGIGVDYKDDQYEIYSQIIDFTNVAKSEQPPNQEAIQAEVGLATGRNIDEAYFNLYHSMDQKLFWGHFSYIVFSEEVLKNERVNPIITSFMQFYNTRYQTWIYSTEDDVKDVMLAKPIINKSITLSKLSDPMNSYKQESFIEPINFRKMILRLNEPGHEVNIPYVKISENWESVKGAQKVTHIEGVGILSKEEFKGFIKKDKAKGLQWMTDDTKRGEITIHHEEAGLLTVILEKIRVKVKPIVDGESVQFDIDFKANAVLSGFSGEVTNKIIREAVEKAIKRDIEDTYEEALKMGADVYRLSEIVYRKELKTWKKIQENGLIPLTEDSIRNIEVHLEEISSGRKSFKESINK